MDPTFFLTFLEKKKKYANLIFFRVRFWQLDTLGALNVCKAAYMANVNSTFYIFILRVCTCAQYVCMYVLYVFGLGTAFIFSLEPFGS